MSAPVIWINAHERPGVAADEVQNTPRFAADAAVVSFDEDLTIN
ncbi:MAG: hypothetical protein PSV40_12865 [Polaromonas sp.]|nr:hypothetical protein [Polaromonas sp.]MDI1269976.1 hypothetical protein [Polaromonas sp.]